MYQKLGFVNTASSLHLRAGSAQLPRTGLDAVCTRCPNTPVPNQQRRARLSMGLFGLGFPEIAVIAGVGILIFGPGKVAEMGKDLGGFAGGVKKATSEFKTAMEESLEEADREIEKKKLEKEASADKIIDTPTSPVETTKDKVEQ